MSQESIESTISINNAVWGLIYKCTLDCEDSILLSKPKYVFGNCWMPQYDVSREQYVEFVKDEFKKTRYYERLCCYHFYIARDDVDDLRPAIICNLTNTVPLYIINEKLITKLSFGEQRILRQGDRVSVSALKDGHLLKFMYTNAKLPFGLDQCPRITSNYFIGRKIGSGGAADVFLMWQINMHYGGSFGQVALKIIHKNKNLISEKNAEIENKRVMREVTAMRQFNNVHVLKLLNYDNKKEHLYIVVPYMEGGNLISRITEYYDKPYIDEDMSRYFFRQLLIGIKYMHSKGWVHRDIKPDNILLSDTTPFPILVISDFGLSKILDNDNTICGTAGYSAPELLQKNKQYDNKIDSWACGIVLYAMLSGNMPFHESYKRHLGIGMNEQVMEANVIFRHPGFLNVSQSAKLLITSLLQGEAKFRWDAALSLNHKWVSNSLTETMIRNAYAANGISFTKEIEESLQSIHLTDHTDDAEGPEPKRMRL